MSTPGVPAAQPDYTISIVMAVVVIYTWYVLVRKVWKLNQRITDKSFWRPETVQEVQEKKPNVGSKMCILQSEGNRVKDSWGQTMKGKREIRCMDCSQYHYVINSTKCQPMKFDADYNETFNPGSNIVGLCSADRSEEPRECPFRSRPRR